MDTKILAVAAIILNSTKTKILLHIREKDPDKGKKELIAGYVRPGERLVETVARKLQSDCGVDIYESIEFTGKYYDDPARHPGASCIPLLFIAIVDDSKPVSGGCVWEDVSSVPELEFALDNKQMILDSGILN